MLSNSTKDEFYKNYIENYLIENPIAEIKLENINEGKILFDLYSQTKNEDYRHSLERLYRSLKGNKIKFEEFHSILPFCMRYETEFNGKQGYFEIYNHFMNAREEMFQEKAGIYENKSIHLIALIDTLEYMSEEIFLEYRGLQIIFKEAVKGIIQYKEEMNVEELINVSYVLLKGCRLGFLNEKYISEGKDIFKEVCEKYMAAHEKKNLGRFLMMCSEAFKI
jgi:unsaturated rhamnogalacturonyl hydrolase